MYRNPTPENLQNQKENCQQSNGPAADAYLDLPSAQRKIRELNLALLEEHSKSIEYYQKAQMSAALLQEQEEKISKLEQQNVYLKETLIAERNKSISLYQQLYANVTEIETLNIRCNELQQGLCDVTSSLVWRISRPIRWVRQLLAKIWER